MQLPARRPRDASHPKRPREGPLGSVTQGAPKASLVVVSSRLSLLVDLASLLTREVDFDALLSTACERLAEAVHADRATIWLFDADERDLVTRVAVLPELPGLRQPADRGIAGFVARTGEVVRIDDVSKDARFDPSADKATGYTTRSMLVAPIREDARSPVRGVVQLLNHASGAFNDDDERYLVALGTQLARALALTTLRAADASGPGVTLRGPFNRIIGRSPELAAVYERVALAAQTDASVLLRGETGTGKGLFARAIHVNSLRQAGPFITIDCTTLPAQLVESELFGHERGAFTGADRKVPGKVEMAEGGTLFLDEVGDLPEAMQGKLLRFLQERKVRSVGASIETAVDVRILAATNRVVEDDVKSGKFRQDLYYRLNVLRIEVPPLRDRREDVPELADRFLQRIATEHNKNVRALNADALRALDAYAFPGNVRELENIIERAVALASSEVLGLGDLPREISGAAAQPTPALITLPEEGCRLDDVLGEVERRIIVQALERSNGVRTQAAKLLGVTLRSLRYRLQKLALATEGDEPTSDDPNED